MTKKEYIERYGEEAYQRYLEQRKRYNQQYREQHREEINEQQKQYYQQYKEERNEYQKQYYQQHREQIAKYIEENKLYLKQYRQRYRKQHREEENQYKKQWSRKNKCMFIYCIPEQIEQIENYEFAKKDNFQGWHIHHRLETHNSDGEKRLVNLSREELIALDMYYNRPANELIFLTASEHAKLHRK